MRRAGLKVVSVVLASLLWLIVSGEQTVERALRIPLEFTNLPSQLELVGEPPTVVDVRVRGSSGTLSRIAAGELVAVLDVRTARAGQRIFHLTGTEVRAPFGVDVVQVAPASLTLLFEKSSSKTVPIVPQIEGEPAQGFVVGGMIVDPPRVEILGPASALENLSRAVTEAVSVAGAKRTVTETVTVGVADPNVRLKGSSTARVSVSIVPAR
jgi:YbbR domain-containing protein